VQRGALLLVEADLIGQLGLALLALAPAILVPPALAGEPVARLHDERRSAGSISATLAA
jgi:hypothetical protein